MKKETANNGSDVMESIISLCKRRGFIYQGSEIYGGLAGTWDYGPYGVALKNNIKATWWKRFVLDRDDMYGMDAAILMNSKAWVASGHVGGFSDPLVECKKCKHRFRADQIDPVLLAAKKCPDCGGVLSEARQFNMMFKTTVGAVESEDSISYLRPETAQGMFVNFKNIMDSFHPKLPFGMAQIGKAFSNEIAPRDFLFRAREFEQMEVEYFIDPKDWEKQFDIWEKIRMDWCLEIGLPKEKIHIREHAKEELSHYSKRTTDIEFDYPFGQKELYGLAYRTDFDLKAHSATSGVDLSYFDEETKQRFTPHVIEPSVGVDRTVLAILSSAYVEDEMGGEKRTYLRLSPSVAPVKVAVFPLLKNKPELVKKAREVYLALKKQFGAVDFDDNGNIGKRYRRQDEIGTPFCVTIDFETLEKNEGVTVRDRDSGKQERVAESDLVKYLSEKMVA
ncbi:MAG: glycine--tRNA ligase [Candidatus Pacebacteria bacterium]|nr:glycine--tRNA ligase [Candidatus Paceibacterota bacterium]